MLSSLTRRQALAGALALPGLALGQELSLERSREEEEAPPHTAGPWKILEIFAVGGLSHQETLWLRSGDAAYPPASGPDPDGFQPTQHGGLVPALAGVSPQAFAGGFSVSGSLAPLWTSSQSGRLWGAARIIATHTGSQDHRTAQALAITGTVPGRPGHFSLAACASEVFGAGAGWVIEHRGGHALQSAMATTGLSPLARPLLLPIGDARFGVAAQERKGVSGAQGALLQRYRQDYRGQIGHSRGLEALEHALDQMTGPVLDLLSVHPPVLPPLAAAADTWTDNNLRQAIRVGAGALTGGGARVATVLVGERAGSFDTHSVASMQLHADLSGHRWWCIVDELRLLAEAGALDLSTTLVVIRSEFGRKLNSLADDGTRPAGSTHFPEGTPVLLLGGPVASRALVGGLWDGPNGREATAGFGHGGPFSPMDLRAVQLAALGIDPLHPTVGVDVAATSFADGQDPVSAVNEIVFGRSPLNSLPITA